MPVAAPTVEDVSDRTSPTRAFSWRHGFGERATWLRLSLLVAAVVGSRPLRAKLPASIGDNSWIYALNAARAEDTRFGHDVIFTYGPWGFLTQPLALDRSGVLMAALACAGAAASLFWLVSHWTQRALGSLAGGVAALALVLVLARFASTSWMLLLVVCGWSLSWLVTRHRSSTSQLVILAVIATLLLQVKFSEGITAILVLAAATLGARSAAKMAVTVGVALVSSVAWWIGAGQQLGDFPAWFSGAVEVAAGYGEAMRRVSAMSTGLLLLAVLVTVLFVVGSIHDDRQRGEPRPVLAWLATGGVLWLGFKQGFVRDDTAHEAQYYMLLAVLSLIGLRRHRAMLGQSLACVLSLALAVLMLLGVAVPAAGVSLRDGWQAVVSPRELDQRVDARRAALREQYQLSPGVRRAIGNGPLLADPGESTVAWAYDIPLSPIPTLEPYSGYTPDLDRTNAEAVLAAGNLTVLRQVGALDGRQQLWDSPRYSLALLCHFAEVDHDDRWSVWKPVASRCGTPRHLDTKRVSAGETITLPDVSRDAMLLVSYAPQRRSLFARLTAAAWRDSPLHVELGGQRYRLPRALAGGPLVADLPDWQQWPRVGERRPSGGSFTVPEAGTVTLSEMSYRRAGAR